MRLIRLQALIHLYTTHREPPRFPYWCTKVHLTHLSSSAFSPALRSARSPARLCAWAMGLPSWLERAPSVPWRPVLLPCAGSVADADCGARAKSICNGTRVHWAQAGAQPVGAALGSHLENPAVPPCLLMASTPVARPRAGAVELPVASRRQPPQLMHARKRALDPLGSLAADEDSIRPLPPLEDSSAADRLSEEAPAAPHALPWLSRAEAALLGRLSGASRHTNHAYA